MPLCLLDFTQNLRCSCVCHDFMQKMGLRLGDQSISGRILGGLRLSPSILQRIKCFLSPPLRMHSGLISIAFCLSVCPSVTGPKVTRPNIISQQPFDLGSLFTEGRCKSCTSCLRKSRWAHVNVKLHFSNILIASQKGCI